MIAARNALKENAKGALDSQSVERLMRTRSMWKPARKREASLCVCRRAISIWATEQHLQVHSVHSPLQLALISTNDHLPLQGKEIRRASPYVNNVEGEKGVNETHKCAQCNSFIHSALFLMAFYLNSNFIYPALRMQSTDVRGAHKTVFVSNSTGYL